MPTNGSRMLAILLNMLGYGFIVVIFTIRLGSECQKKINCHMKYRNDFFNEVLFLV